MNFVLDASVALSWCFDDERTRPALDVLERPPTDEAVVAHHWGLEVANGLLTAERRGRLAAGDAIQAMRMLRALPIAIHPAERDHDLTRAHRLTRAHGLTSYDSAYLDLALRLGVPLATLDARLEEAAEAEGVGAL